MPTLADIASLLDMTVPRLGYGGEMVGIDAKLHSAFVVEFQSLTKRSKQVLPDRPMGAAAAAAPYADLPVAARAAMARPDPARCAESSVLGDIAIQQVHSSPPAALAGSRKYRAM